MTQDMNTLHETDPSTLSASAIEERRVSITVGAGIVGVLVYIVGFGLAIWGYAVSGFEIKDLRIWLGGIQMFAGLAVFGWLLYWNRDLDRVSPAIRRTLYGYNIFLSIKFLAAILVLVNIFVTQYGNLIGIKPSYDWTSEGSFTLSSVSVQHVKEITKPMKVIALYPLQAQFRSQIEQLLQLYSQANRDFTFEFMDPNEDKIKAEEIMKKYPESMTREPSLIVTYGTGEDPTHKVIKLSDLVKAKADMDPFGRGSGAVESEFHGENAITSTIRMLVDDKKTNIYFTNGHGELELTNSDARGEGAEQGIGLLSQRLTDVGLKPEPLDLLKSEVPSDATLLVIAGPKTTFHPSEVQKIRDFMDRRDSSNARTARLFAMFDSAKLMNPKAPHDAGLGELLATYKVAVKDNLVYDTGSAIGEARQIMVHLDSEKPVHQIVAPFKNKRALMIIAREIAPISDAPPGMPGMPPGGKYQATKLFSSSESPRSWAQADYSTGTRPSPTAEGNTPGPVCLGVAVTESEGPPPMPPHMGAPPPPQKSTPVAVVIGDAMFASNAVVSSPYADYNEDLFLNVVNWLGGRIADIGIQPRVKKTTPLDLDNAGYFIVIFEPFFHLVAIAGFAAGLVWVVRADRFQLLWLPISGTMVLMLIWAIVARVFIGPFGGEATRITLMRFMMTCLLLWAVGISFWFSKMRPARSAEAA